MAQLNSNAGRTQDTNRKSTPENMMLSIGCITLQQSQGKADKKTATTHR